MVDAKTIEIYNAKADEYVEFVSKTIPDQDLRAFMEALPQGGIALDLGCGPGNTAAMLQDAGFTVDATDASEKMVEMARDKFSVQAKVATFDDLSAENHYDGIWANFSLLHAQKSDMPKHLAAIHKALKSDGHFHIGLKLGVGEQRDKIDRMYAYYEEAELKDLLKNAGFTVISTRLGKEAGLAGSVDPYIIITAHA
jgi:trans-aconitate methyltransferase